MPIDLHMDRWIYLHGRVNGIDTDILLDSGAGMTVLDRAFAESAGLKPRVPWPRAAPAASPRRAWSKASRCRSATLTIGPLMAARDRPGRRLAADRSADAGHPRQGAVPRPGRRCRLPQRADPLPRRRGLPLRRPRPPPRPARRRGRAQERAVVDGRRRARRRGPRHRPGRRAHRIWSLRAGARIPDRPAPVRVPSGGVGGATISKTCTLSAVTIAGYTSKDVPVAIHQDDVKGAFDTKRQSGNLGAGILNRFRVLFDYEHDSLWLEPATATRRAAAARPHRPRLRTGRTTPSSCASCPRAVPPPPPAGGKAIA